jgi:hypothetical protein
MDSFLRDFKNREEIKNLTRDRWELFGKNVFLENIIKHISSTVTSASDQGGAGFGYGDDRPLISACSLILAKILIPNRDRSGEITPLTSEQFQKNWKRFTDLNELTFHDIVLGEPVSAEKKENTIKIINALKEIVRNLKQGVNNGGKSRKSRKTKKPRKSKKSKKYKKTRKSRKFNQ